MRMGHDTVNNENFVFKLITHEWNKINGTTCFIFTVGISKSNI